MYLIYLKNKKTNEILEYQYIGDTFENIDKYVKEQNFGNTLTELYIVSKEMTELIEFIKKDRDIYLKSAMELLKDLKENNNREIERCESLLIISGK